MHRQNGFLAHWLIENMRLLAFVSSVAMLFGFVNPTLALPANNCTAVFSEGSTSRNQFSIGIGETRLLPPKLVEYADGAEIIGLRFNKQKTELLIADTDSSGNEWINERWISTGFAADSVTRYSIDTVARTYKPNAKALLLKVLRARIANNNMFVKRRSAPAVIDLGLLSLEKEKYLPAAMLAQIPRGFVLEHLLIIKDHLFVQIAQERFLIEDGRRHDSYFENQRIVKTNFSGDEFSEYLENKIQENVLDENAKGLLLKTLRARTST